MGKKPKAIKGSRLQLLPKKWGRGRKKFNGENPETVLSKLRDAWDIGATDSEAAWHAGISSSALARLLDEQPDLREERDQRKEKMITLSRAVLGNHLEKGDKQTAQWLLERKKKDEFSTRQEVINTNFEVEDEDSFNRLMDLPINEETKPQNTPVGNSEGPVEESSPT